MLFLWRFPNGGGGAASAVDSDALLWELAVIANGGTVSNLFLFAVSNYITAEKQSGVWARRDDYWILLAENSIQARTSLKQRRLATEAGSPQYIPFSGYKFDGSSSYLKTGFICSTMASAMTLHDVEVSVWEATNVASSTFTMGASASGSIEICPRTGGGQYVGEANTGQGTIAGSTTSVGLTSVYQGQGVNFGVYKNGASIGTSSPTTLTGLPTVEYYIGALNNAGTATSFRATTVSFVATGGSLTLAQEAAAYGNLVAFFNALPVPDIYISASGSDSTGNGTAALPFKTWDVGYTAAASGARIFLDGTALTPTVYQSATATTIAKSLTISAINQGGAILSGVNTTTGVTISTGITAVFNGIVFDPSTNSGGAAARAVDFGAGVFNTTFNNCTLQNWTTYGFNGVTGTVSGSIIWNGQTINGGTIQAACYFPAIASGTTLAFNNPVVTITNKLSVGFGVFHLNGSTGPSPAVSFVNPSITCTLDSSQTGTGIDYLIRLTDMVVTGSGGTFTGTAPAGSRDIHCISVNQSVLGISGSTWNTATITDNGNGGIGFLMGLDGAGDKTLAQNCSVSGLAVSGNAAVEGIVFGSVTDGSITNCSATGVDVVGGKDCLRLTMSGNTMTDIPSSSLGWVEKGNVNSSIHNNTINQTQNSGTVMMVVEANSDRQKTITAITQANPGKVTATGHGYATGDVKYISGVVGMTQVNGQRYTITVVDANNFTIGVDTTAFTAYSSGGIVQTPSVGAVISANTYNVSGGSGHVFVLQDVASLASYNNSSYQKTGGTLAATPWLISGTNYSTFAAYQAAVEPTATSNIP